MVLKRYEEFLDRVHELGFMSLSDVLPGMPSLSAETAKDSWHSGDPDTDPWVWKDRAAEEKRLAFGCILGGHKGYVAPEWYSVFFSACHPREHMEARWAAGEISQPIWALWQLFQEKTLLDTSDIRQAMGVTRKQGGSAIDTAIKELQREYYITVVGNRRKVNKMGQPYGWPAIVYDLVENWAPSVWVDMNPDICPAEARERILARGEAWGVAPRELARKLRFSPFNI